MNGDLERALNGTDADMKAFVASLRQSPAARVSDNFTADVMARIRLSQKHSQFTSSRRFFNPATLFPLAACLVALLAIGAIFMRPVPTFTLSNLVACQRADGYFTGSPAAPYVQAFAVTVLAKDPTADRKSLDHAVDALVRTQNAAGGWLGNEVTARNVAALSIASKAGAARAMEAYRRGVRYLRRRGIAELAPAEMAGEAKAELARLGSRHEDRGALCCLTLCAKD